MKIGEKKKSYADKQLADQVAWVSNLNQFHSWRYIIINTKQKMTVRNRKQESKRKYAKISLKKRQTLVDLVINQECGLTKTAKKLNLKLSTAKLILRKYKQTGKFHIRRLRKSAPEIVEPLMVKEQQNDASNFLEDQEEKGQEKAQEPIFSTNIYPVMYGDLYYPYYGVYVWPVDNYYQFI